MININQKVFSSNIVITAVFVLSFFTICCTQYPPKLITTNSKNENKKIIKTGESVSLQCPVEMSSNDEIYFEWFKNGNPIENFDKRVRITDSGHLRIKNSNTEDTGLFMCRAINGFGSVEFSNTLIVLDEDYDILDEKQQINPSYDSEVFPSLKSTQTKVNSQITPKIIIKKTGSSVRLHCLISGTPKSSIIWFHNSQQFTDSEPRKGRNSLVINDLKPEDSGNYTCLSSNQLGGVVQTFIIKVIDTLVSEPHIEGNDPSNASVVINGEITLYCSIKSDEFPRIQWLKKMEMTSDAEEADNYESISDSSHYIKVMGELYKILESTPTLHISDNLYSNDLIIRNANELDAGKYLCLAANQMGSNFKNAYLSVISNPKEMTTTDIITKRDLFPLPILIAIVSVVLIIVLALIVWMSMCLFQKSEPNVRVIHTSYETTQKARPLRPEFNRTYNPMNCNKFVNIRKSPSDQMRAESPLYSEIMGERHLSNVYQLYTNPKEVNVSHNHSLKAHYFC